ncbi:hypothetical protein HJFPF1_01067 [Paramyrothecium foliicola]|nr:hypothetical protein HJFPF1_01067 [Paramyrothecium foliicola]
MSPSMFKINTSHRAEVAGDDLLKLPPLFVKVTMFHVMHVHEGFGVIDAVLSDRYSKRVCTTVKALMLHSPVASFPLESVNH